ncbi:hypothetical protein EVAR_9794_1 [Eumeta japonica]|uniref:Uncharacterized protein n=1 Tax=Eumeta variegata TaxID=151549 RepID=A0A4C1U5M8_EUMVA|nr:hypothetical protein EVAR_9794_1 [Eumeta japonica]
MPVRLCARAHGHSNPETSICSLSNSLLFSGMAVSFYHILPFPKPQYRSELISFLLLIPSKFSNPIITEIKNYYPRESTDIVKESLPKFFPGNYYRIRGTGAGEAHILTKGLGALGSIAATRFTIRLTQRDDTRTMEDRLGTPKVLRYSPTRANEDVNLLVPSYQNDYLNV